MRQTTQLELEAEHYAREHLLASGAVEYLKQAGVKIWTIRVYHGRMRLAIDTEQAPQADKAVIEDELTHILQPLLDKLSIPLTVAFSPISGNCCYGVCQGCMNGDPEQRRQWID